MLIHERQTPFGYLTVHDLPNSVRGIFIDDVCQGRAKMPSLNPVSWYLREVFTKVGNIQGVHKALVLGGGAGILPSLFEERYGITTDTIEQSGDMIQVAQEYFGFEPTGKIIQGDAFAELPKLGKYDVIVYDLFNGLIPAQGPSSFFYECLDHLNPNGHFLVNVVMQDRTQYVMELTKNEEAKETQTPQTLGRP
jgi:spermidine synthase